MTGLVFVVAMLCSSNSCALEEIAYPGSLMGCLIGSQAVLAEQRPEARVIWWRCVSGRPA